MWMGFRIRGRQRDHRTDALRLARLVSALDEVETSLLKERNGLQKRCERAMASAAFAQQRLEDERADAELSGRIDELTTTLKAYDRRMEKLESQLALIEQMRATMEDFTEDQGLAREAGPPQSLARH